MEEIWKPIRGYEGLYEVSNMGRVKSLPKVRPAASIIHGKYIKTTIHRKERLLRLGSNPRGYAVVTLCNHNKRNPVTVHSLVWDAFGDKPRNGRIIQVDHINANKKDNRITNLQLLSNRANTQKRVMQSGKVLPIGVCTFENRYRAVVTLKNRKQQHLGLFKNISDAKTAYDNFVIKHGDLL